MFPFVYFSEEASRITEGDNVVHPILLSILLGGLIAGVGFPSYKWTRVVCYAAIILYFLFYGFVTPLAFVT
jgi:hypothetical protein